MPDRTGNSIQLALKRLERCLAKLQKRLGDADVLVDDISYQMVTIRARTVPTTTSPARVTGRFFRTGTEGAAVIGTGAPGRPATAEAAALRMSVRSDGSSIVRFDGARPFRLTPRLTALLRILATGTDEGETLAGWRRKDEIAHLLEKRLGRKFRPHTIANLIYRLRGAMEHSGISRDLLQTDRRKGVRLAVSREAVHVTEAAPS